MYNNNKKIKIVQTPARFFPYIGGVEKYVYDLSKELVNNGYNVEVVCANEPKSKVNTVCGINIKRLSYIFKITNTNITLGLFFTLMKSDFDIIHTHFPTPWSADISMLVSLLKRRPLVITYHNDVVKTGFSSILARIYNNTLLSLVLWRASIILVTQPNYVNVSKYLKKFNWKIRVIPNGIDIDTYKKIDTKIVPNQLFFLSVLDKYHRYKGLDFLLDSINFVKNEIPNIRLVVGGSGELVDYYKNLTHSLKIDDRVDFIGFVKQEELVRIFNQSEIFILPSISKEEGFGIVLLEALSCGTPVISTSIVGIADDIKKYQCGIIVSPKNPYELSEAINLLLNKKDIHNTYGLKGKLLVENHYNWKQIVRDVEIIYKEILDNR